MSGVVSSGCCCTKESCPVCCDFWACSPSTPFPILLTGSWISSETLSPTGQVITTGEIHWSITATMTRTGSNCATYRYYANSCQFSYEYIQRRWSFGGEDVPTDGSLPSGTANPLRCTKHYRFDLDGDGLYEGTLTPPLESLEYRGLYNNGCERSACPCAVADGVYALTTGRCSCVQNDYCRTAGFTCENSTSARFDCFFWNCTSFQSGFADQNACNGFGPKPAANILAKVVEVKTWSWNVTLTGNPSPFLLSGLDNGNEINCSNHANYWVPNSVITIACKRNCDPDCDSPILIFNPNMTVNYAGTYTVDTCMGPCIDVGCDPPAYDCSTSYSINLPKIAPWVIYGSGTCLSDTTFDNPITAKGAANPALCGPPPAQRWSDDLPSTVFYSAGGFVTNLDPPNIGGPGGTSPFGTILVLNMCGIDQYCTPLDRTYTEKRVTYDPATDVTHTYPLCCTRDVKAYIEVGPCEWFNPATGLTETVNLPGVYCDPEVTTCPDFPTMTGVTTHTIEWGFEI